MDTIVIGAGAMGSAAAYWLSKFQDVALVEQYDLLHTHGSSHGKSRVIRRTYQQDHFAEMMTGAYRLWHQIQQETGKQVVHQTGGLDFGKEGNTDLATTLDICERAEISHEVLIGSEISARYPAYQLNDDYWGIYQKDTGILDATTAVDLLQQYASRQGTQMLTGNPVTAIHPNDDYVVVETASGSFRANNLVITAGAWVNHMLEQFDLRLDTEIWKLTFAYWKVQRPEWYMPDKFPVFISWGESDDYGFPIHERPDYIKIAPHHNPQIERVSAPPDQHKPDKSLLNHLSEFISSTFDGIDPVPQFKETCLYTMTADENFIMDYIPGYDNIFVAAGFSGHGFKFSPLIGKIIQQEIMSEDHTWDLSPFQLADKLIS